MTDPALERAIEKTPHWGFRFFLAFVAMCIAYLAGGFTFVFAAFTVVPLVLIYFRSRDRQRKADRAQTDQENEDQ